MRYYYVFSFGQRTECVRFYSLLRRTGAGCMLINTPSAISRACGLSVKAETGGLRFARDVLRSGAWATFIGAFEVEEKSGAVNIKRIPR